MPKTTPTPQTIVVRSITANRWEIASYRVDTPTDGQITMSIAVIAREMDGAAEISRTALDLVQVAAGTDLHTLIADFGMRTIMYLLGATHLPDDATIGTLKAIIAANPTGPGYAYYQATCDALEARVQAAGVIPPEAA